MENNWRLRLCIMRAACIHLSYNVTESCYVNAKEVLPNDIRNTIGKQFENGLGSSLLACNVWSVILFLTSCVSVHFATEGNWKFASKRLHIYVQIVYRHNMWRLYCRAFRFWELAMRTKSTCLASWYIRNSNTMHNHTISNVWFFVRDRWYSAKVLWAPHVHIEILVSVQYSISNCWCN